MLLDGTSSPPDSRLSFDSSLVSTSFSHNRKRGKTVRMGNDERENTLNQLLVEMDGMFDE